MSTPETKEPSSIYFNLDSDAFLKGTSVNSRLSLLGKELYDNIENLILDENILGKAFNKRNLDKKTIYSAYKFKLNLDELNSDSASVENVLIEEKNREILFKGEEDEEEKIEEEEKKEIKVEKRMNEEELFGDIEKNIDENIKKMKEKKNKVKNKEELADEFDKFLQEGNNDNNKIEVNNNAVNNKNDNNNAKKEKFDSSANLFQDLSYYEQEYNEQNKPLIIEDNPNP